MSYYGYERLRPGDALGIDMATVTKSLSDDLKAYEQKKADDAAGVATTSREFAELLGKMPTSFNQEYNRFFGDTSQAAMQSASKVNQQFNNGDIDKRTYDILMANLNSQVSMTVDSMTKYATMINDIEEKKSAGELSDEDLFKLSQLQEFSDLGNVSIAFDPESYQANLIKVGEGLKGGYDIMSINQYFNGVNMKFQGQYDTAGAITSTLKNLTGVQDITTASGKQEVGRFISTNEGKEALTNASEAMLSQPTALRGFAMANTIKDGEDTVNFEYASVPMEYYEIGGILTEEKLKELQDKNPYIFYQDKSGRFYESDKAKEVILKNAEEMLKGAADYTLVEPEKVTTTVDAGKSYDRFIRGLELINRTGKKVPKEYIDLLLDSVPGLDLSSVQGIQFEDRQVEESVSERKERLKRERDQATVKNSNTWYETEFLTNVTEGEKYNVEKLRNLLINTPFVVDETGMVTLGDAEVYSFDKPNKIYFDDIVDFKTKLKAVLDPNQEVFLYYTANPDAMTDEGGVDYSNY